MTSSRQHRAAAAAAAASCGEMGRLEDQSSTASSASADMPLPTPKSGEAFGISFRKTEAEATYVFVEDLRLCRRTKYRNHGIMGGRMKGSTCLYYPR